jgi:di/tricarboxylate transporter
MNWEAWFTIGVVAIGVVALVREAFAPDLIFLGLLSLLLVAGILSPEEALIGFANPGMIAVGALFVVAGALQNTGALGFVATRIFGQIGDSPRRALFKMMAPIAGISAFLNNTPIVAMFMPVVIDWTRRNRVSPSRYLIPLSYATILGGACTLIGTSTSLVANGLIIGYGMPSMSFFELGGVGVPCALAGLAFLTLFSRRLLPNYKDLVASIEENRREYLIEMEVASDCPLAGKGIEEAGLRHLPGLFLIRIERAEEIVAPVGPEERLKVGDLLVFTGAVSTIVDLQKIRGLIPAGDHREGQKGFFAENNLCEAVVSEDSPLVGSTIRDANFRTRYGAAVVAVHRGGKRLSGKIGDIVMRPGDTLLLEASPGFARTFRHSPDFYLVSEIPDSAPPRFQKAAPAILVLIALVTVVTAGILPMVTASLVAASIVVISGCLSVGEVRGAVDTSVLLLIATAFGVGKALEKTGAAGTIAMFLVEIGATLGPIGVLAAVYLATAILTEVISNAAAVALVFPVAFEAARQFGVDARPFAIAITAAASSSFASPIGYQTNLMIYGPGGYKFTDFLKIGIPLKLLVFAVAMVCIPYFWPFSRP